MRVPRLESCCFCLDLRTGNFIIGSINAVFSFILTMVMITTVTIEYYRTKEDQIKGHSAITGIYAMSIILAISFLAKFYFDIIFIFGVYAKRAGIIKAYCTMWIIFFILSTFTFFLNVSYFAISTICIESFYVGLNVYAVLMSYNLYKQLEELEEI